jgi:hypothetical protein
MVRATQAVKRSPVADDVADVGQVGVALGVSDLPPTGTFRPIQRLRKRWVD